MKIKPEHFINTSIQQFHDFNASSWITGRGYEIPEYPIFNKCMEGLESGMYLFAAESNSGKALALDTPILQTNGKWTTIGDIKIGAQVWGDDGLPTFVVMKSPIFQDHDCYCLTCDDGSTFIADADHRWKVWHNCSHKPHNREQIKTTAEMYQCFKHVNPDRYPHYWYRIPMQAAIVSYPERTDLPIPPYALGVWLGNGRSRDNRITVHIDDYEEEKKYLEDVNVAVSEYRLQRGSLGVEYSVGYIVNRRNLFKEGLKQLNLINNKHIPEQYLHASIEQRWELLKGLMDTDGSVSHGLCEFTQKATSKINDNFGELLSSLGIKWSTSDKTIILDGKTFYAKRYHFAVSKANTCFKKERKTNLLRDHLRDRSFLYKTIIDIQEIETVPTQCIQVSNESHCYLVGDHLTITHNTAVMQDLALKYALNSKNKLFTIYFSLDDTADKIIPRMLAANSKLAAAEHFGVPISLFSKPQRYLDRLRQIEDYDSDEAKVLYSYLYEDISAEGVVNPDIVRYTKPIEKCYPKSVRAKALRWLEEVVAPRFKIVDGNVIHSGEELIEYCKRLKDWIRAEYDPSWNILVVIDSLFDLTWEDQAFRTDKELNDYTSMTVKAWSVEVLKCPIFGSIHLRKIDQKKRPTIADVKESGRWIYEASVVFLLHNEASRSGDLANVRLLQDRETVPVIEVQWAKNKQSSFKGRTYVAFYTNQSRVEECTQEQTDMFNRQLGMA